MTPPVSSHALTEAEKITVSINGIKYDGKFDDLIHLLVYCKAAYYSSNITTTVLYFGSSHNFLRGILE